MCSKNIFEVKLISNLREFTNRKGERRGRTRRKKGGRVSGDAFGGKGGLGAVFHCGKPERTRTPCVP